MHRPMIVTGLFRVTKLLKPKDVSWKTHGFIDLAEHQQHHEPMCLHVIFGDMITTEYFAKSHRTSLHKELWLVFINSSIEDFFASANLPFSLELLVVHMMDADHASVWDVFRANNMYPVRSRLLGSWDKRQGLKLQHHRLYTRRHDLEGIRLRIGLIENWPISYEVHTNGQQSWKGLFPSIWRQLEETFNISSLPKRYSSTGSLRADGSWSGLIGSAVRGEMDVIVSELTMNERRLNVLDFSQPVLKSKYQIFFKQPGLVLDWTTALKPFPKTLWMAIMVWVLAAAGCLAFCSFVCTRVGLEKEPYPAYGFISFFFFILQSLSQQGGEDVPRSSTCRILFFSSYLVSAVVIPAYSASLISSLTQKTPYIPFNSVSEMLHDGTFKLLVANNTAEYDYFADTKDTTLSQAYQRLIKTVPPQYTMTGITQALQTVCHEDKYALFGIEAIISRRIQRTPRPDCEIISMTRSMSTMHLGMALPRNHPLQPLVNYQIGLFIERGILSRIESVVWPPTAPATADFWTEVRAEEVFHIFAFLGSAVVLSIIIFLFELFIFNWHRVNHSVTAFVPFIMEYNN